MPAKFKCSSQNREPPGSPALPPLQRLLPGLNATATSLPAACHPYLALQLPGYKQLRSLHWLATAAAVL